MHDPLSSDGQPRGSSSRTADLPEPDAAAPEGLIAQGRALVDSLQRIVGELPGLVGDRVELLSLELTRAGQALTKIILLLVGAAVLGVTGWIALWAVAVLVLMRFGLSADVALLIVVALNGVVALWALHAAKAQVRLVGLPATRRRLSFHRLEPTVDAAANDSAAAAAQAAPSAPAATPAAQAAAKRPAPTREDESADPVGDGHTDADFAAALPPDRQPPDRR